MATISIAALAFPGWAWGNSLTKHMSDTPTPLTDAECCVHESQWIPASFARTLEREIAVLKQSRAALVDSEQATRCEANNLRADLERLRSDFKTAACVVERGIQERDELRKKLLEVPEANDPDMTWHDDWGWLHKSQWEEIVQLREDRDKLRAEVERFRVQSLQLTGYGMSGNEPHPMLAAHERLVKGETK